jgi:hypothetical protein
MIVIRAGGGGHDGLVTLFLLAELVWHERVGRKQCVQRSSREDSLKPAGTKVLKPQRRRSTVRPRAAEQ